MSTPGDDRRIHPRFSKTFELAGAPDAGGVTARLVASNLSLGGVYCTSDHDFPEMTRLAVRLMLPSRNGGSGKLEPVDVAAVVVRRKPIPSITNRERFELALLFMSLSPAQRDRIAYFLETEVADAGV